MTQPSSSEAYTEAERNAMRAYLARAEVRLSTMHRIVTAFVGGAGLLLLIPVFFRDVVDIILLNVLDTFGNQFLQLNTTSGWILTILLYVLLLYPFFFSLTVPLYGVYLLLKDIVQFYYSIYMPGFSQTVLNPTLSLPALMFSSDESVRVKHDTMRWQYDTRHMNYVMPFSEPRRKRYLDLIADETDDEIIPFSRRISELTQAGINLDEIGEKDARRLSTAFGIARGMDRSLIEEVALVEMMLTRNVLFIRRLVLRYAKTLLMFIWTTVISFLMLPFLQQKEHFPVFIILGSFYLVWSVAVMPIVRSPIYWIFRHRIDDPHPQHIDAQLTFFEGRILKYSRLAIVSSFAGLLLAVVQYFL